MAENYWFTLDMSVVARNDDSISLTFKDEDGSALDVSGWSNMVYRAEERGGTDEIDVADADISVTSSGSGVDDRIVIPLGKNALAVSAGRYDHEFAAEINSRDRTIFRGTLTVVARIAEVP